MTSLWREAAGPTYDSEHEAAIGAFLGGMKRFGAFLLNQMQTGAVERAYAQVRIQQRALEAALGLALRRQDFVAAQQILQPLDDFWDAAGLYASAKAWCDRAISETGDGGKRSPDPETDAGRLWRFALGTEANRAVLRRDLDRAERAYRTLVAQLDGRATPAAKASRAVGFHQLGVVAYQRGDLGAAEDWYKKSLATREEIGDRTGMASTYHQLGMVAQRRGDLGAAEESYKKGLAIKEEVGDRTGMASAYGQLGNLALDRNDQGAAEEWYKKGLAIDEEISSRPGMASFYHQLGVVAQRRRDLGAAEEWYKKSLAIKEEISDRAGMGSTYHQLGMVAQERGDLDAAEDWCKTSLAIEEEIGNRDGVAKSLAQLGLLAQERGRADDAFDYAVRAVAPFAEFPSRHSSAPLDLARLTEAHGEAALAASWKRVSGDDLPDLIREGVQALVAALKTDKDSAAVASPER